MFKSNGISYIFKYKNLITLKNSIKNRKVYLMKFPKLPNSCFRNDGIIDRL